MLTLHHSPYLANLILAREKVPMAGEHAVVVFFFQLMVLLLVGRLLGELMQRMGQPAVMGQLLAGVALGPSLLGAISPAAFHWLFPNSPEQKAMRDAVSQIGVLLLLLLTGMETDISLIRRVGRTAIFSSFAGVALPFTSGFILGELLPDAMLPNPSQRLATSLFIATMLSISSVKIVAMVIMEVGFLRRNIGQLILTSAILDDTIGWIVIAITAAIATQGTVNPAALAHSVIGTIIFLVFSFTLGRRYVAHIIRWTNDYLSIELPVITAILVLMFVGALMTDFIGVHTVLGAFVVGILVGQSPILTRHIEEQLRGLIVAFFAPVFFAVAGLSIDLSVMKSAYLVQLAIALIAIASFGKLVGCYVGGRLGGLNSRESAALAIGMNARGSTEVIVASIGLSLGVLTQDIYTLVVVMAITTTMVTPPLLRWALRRIPPTGEERERLEKERAEERDFVPQVERLLIAVDDGKDGQLASMLAGMFAGTRHILSTVFELKQKPGVKFPAPLALADDKPGEIVKAAADEAARSGQHEAAKGLDSTRTPLVVADRSASKDFSAALLNEVKKGYDMIFFGVEGALTAGALGRLAFASPLQKVVQEFEGASAIAIARQRYLDSLLRGSLNILVPVTGADYSRRAAEIAVALARASKSPLTALYVAPPPSELDLIRRPRERTNPGRALIRDIRELGEREGVTVKPRLKIRPNPEAAILRQIERGRHNLVVIGVKNRSTDELFFGNRVSNLLENVPCSLLLINS